MNEKTILIIDGNSLLNRAFYAMQKPMLTKDGLYTQGVYGFLNILSKAEKDYEPKYIAITFDRKAPTFRHLEYEEYKAGRRKMPPELAMQFDPLKDVLRAMRIRIYEMDGFEADDLIGTIARRSEEAGLEPLIITGDRDALQLAGDSTKVLITKKGISEFELYDKDAMIAEYGMTPSEFIDLKAVMGDKSDNIPGIPGVGIKGGTELIKQFSSVENMLAHTDEIASPALRKKVEENAQLALMSKRLATIDTNAPVDFDPADCVFKDPDYDALVDEYTRLEFKSFIKRLKRPEGSVPAARSAMAAADGATAEAVAYELSQKEYLIEDEKGLELLREELKSTKEGVLKVFSDDNHSAKPWIESAWFLGKEHYFGVSGTKSELLSGFVKALCESGAGLYGHELVRDYYALLSGGFSLQRGENGRFFNTCFDTSIAKYVLDAGRKSYDLPSLMNEYFHEGFEDEKSFFGKEQQLGFFDNSWHEKSSAFFREYARAVSMLREAELPYIESEGLGNVFYKIELPLIEVLAAMEEKGFKVDKNVLKDIGANLSVRIVELERSIYEDAGEEFNINSPQQLGNILFGEDKLALPAGKKTRRGYSTSAETLEKLRDRHPIIDKILEYRTLAKLKGTYIEGLLPLIHEDGRIHAHFRQSVAATGRISCTEPNLQNIPIRQSLGRTIRKAFVPAEGQLLSGADYSQIELRVLAAMSGEEGLIESFNRGDDIHRLTASRVFGVPFDEVSSEQRSAAKAVNFGVIYGMSSFGLSSEIHVSRREAERYISDYFEQHPAVKAFMDGEIELASRDGYVTTITGRKRYIPEIKASQYMVRQLGERLAMNTPIQGSAADIIKIAMSRVYERLAKEGLSSAMILQIHDELIIETKEDEKAAVERILREEMEGAMDLPVRLTVDLNTADNWYDLK